MAGKSQVIYGYSEIHHANLQQKIYTTNLKCLVKQEYQGQMALANLKGLA